MAQTWYSLIHITEVDEHQTPQLYSYFKAPSWTLMPWQANLTLMLNVTMELHTNRRWSRCVRPWPRSSTCPWFHNNHGWTQTNQNICAQHFMIAVPMKHNGWQSLLLCRPEHRVTPIAILSRLVLRFHKINTQSRGRFRILCKGGPEFCARVMSN